MNNEEKILQILGQMQGDISDIKEDVSGLKEDVSGLKESVAGIQDNIAEMKEEATITRHSVNLLLRWAEKADRTAVNVGLFDR